MTFTLIVILVVIFGLITGFFTILAAVKIVGTNKNAIKLRKEILMEGIPAQAIIQDIAETSSSMDGRPGVRLDLLVTQEDGQTFQSVVNTFIPVIHIPKFQKGSVINVRYIGHSHERKVEVEDAYIP